MEILEFKNLCEDIKSHIPIPDYPYVYLTQRNKRVSWTFGINYYT